VSCRPQAATRDPFTGNTFIEATGNPKKNLTFPPGKLFFRRFSGELFFRVLSVISVSDTLQSNGGKWFSTKPEIAPFFRIFRKLFDFRGFSARAIWQARLLAKTEFRSDAPFGSK
jgi:hypothetical protein